MINWIKKRDLFLISILRRECSLNPFGECSSAPRSNSVLQKSQGFFNNFNLSSYSRYHTVHNVLLHKHNPLSSAEVQWSVRYGIPFARYPLCKVTAGAKDERSIGRRCACTHFAQWSLCGGERAQPHSKVTRSYTCLLYVVVTRSQRNFRSLLNCLLLNHKLGTP